ncbi:MAG: UDP-N-acetylmuramoyl-L-alanine--D-glutamate ligase [Alphaproteobacteria bacterium]|nr:UDP-N-acetylmuramoyl-L-alanine--D-glutamate ligase [Alphaproteobacteria bacterium]MBU0795680.1 UDP-N-acetylmuramoyl-L-alanine--D-glutamate ligase [Alphaproteobacteria bacterium]MBU0887303.1 UDP-N-acetylmuramoyl-L-alanine--D-glutamate ligase [Alphaproteobacteria bacterium]MBU1811816.1 UDP-N-acetylmuramoyl-L-alanine--D-glutamate ligase [Alphaproteobacteria bacterium]
MIDLSFLRNRRIAVMGLARSGIASVTALVAAGAEVLAWDDTAARRDEAAKAGATITDLANADWSTIDLAVWSPGIPHSFPAPHAAAKAAKAAGVALVCDIELLALANPQARFLGITGTNGKSTTTALIGHILKQAGIRAEIGGNLGMAALTLAPLGADGVYVLELSSYQIELLDKARFDLALLLNITPDHLDRHGGFDGYVAAKRRLFDRLAAEGAAIIGLDDAASRGMAAGLGRAVTGISVEHPVAAGIYVEAGRLVDATQGSADTILALTDLTALPGAHNWQNAAFAYAACTALGVAREAIIAGIRSFPGLAHRQERVAVIDGVAFINDSKATNAEATARALACYERIHWITGGKAKDGGIDSLDAFFPRIRKAYLIGESAQAFADTLEGKVACRQCGTLDIATAAAAADARGTGGVVLLSPAAASFDQFQSFEHRGDAFRTLVQALADRPASTVTGGAA